MGGGKGVWERGGSAGGSEGAGLAAELEPRRDSGRNGEGGREGVKRVSEFCYTDLRLINGTDHGQVGNWARAAILFLRARCLLKGSAGHEMVQAERAKELLTEALDIVDGPLGDVQMQVKVRREF